MSFSANCFYRFGLLHIKASIFLFLFFFLNYSCSNKDTHIVFTGECQTEAIPVHLNKVVKTLGTYLNQYIEIEGYYRWGSEQSGIYLSRFSGNHKALWVEFNEHAKLRDSKTGKTFYDVSNSMNLIDKRRIKIKGKLVLEKGHLDEYAATITNLCHLEVLN